MSPLPYLPECDSSSVHFYCQHLFHAQNMHMLQACKLVNVFYLFIYFKSSFKRQTGLAVFCTTFRLHLLFRSTVVICYDVSRCHVCMIVVGLS